MKALVGELKKIIEDEDILLKVISTIQNLKVFDRCLKF